MPYWAKISNEATLTRATKAKEWGFSLLYDNPVKDMSFGLLWKKEDKTSANFTQVDTNSDNTITDLNKTDVKITDIFLKKKWGKLTAALEVVLMTGTLGDVYENQGAVNYKAKLLSLSLTTNSIILGPLRDLLVRSPVTEAEAEVMRQCI